MAKSKRKILVGDFETTVYEEQEKTEVWASAVCELFTEDAHVFHSIDDTFRLPEIAQIKCYYLLSQFEV